MHGTSFHAYFVITEIKMKNISTQTLENPPNYLYTNLNTQKQLLNHTFLFVNCSIKIQIMGIKTK